MNDEGTETFDWRNVSVSSGTMRTQDLLPVFLSTTRVVAPAVYEQLMTGPFGYIPAFAMDDDDSDWWVSADADYKLEELFDVLTEYAPDGFYFGAHQGNGSDYGFWEDYE